jgi:Abortive infection C-terminus
MVSGFRITPPWHQHSDGSKGRIVCRKRIEGRAWCQQETPSYRTTGIQATKSRAGSGLLEMRSGRGRGVNQLFIDQQIKKCDRKLAENDFDGAITNARSLLEAVLSEVEQELSPQSPEPYDGDLVKLYKRVQKLLNLEPSRTDIAEPLKQVLGGLASIVSGLAALRNKMGDAHVRSYQPAKRHAVLVVNAAKTLAAFVVETKEHNVARGASIKPLQPPGFARG